MNLIQKQNGLPASNVVNGTSWYKSPAYLPVNARDPFASSKILRTSLIPEEVALSSLKMQFASLARSLERVVFPQLW